MEEMRNGQPQNPFTEDEKKASHELMKMSILMKKTVENYQYNANLIIERALQYENFDPPEEHIADLTLIGETLDPMLLKLEKAAEGLKKLQTLIQPIRLQGNTFFADTVQDEVTCYLAETTSLHIPSLSNYCFITTHTQFKDMYGIFVKSLKNSGVTTKILYENASSSVIEFKIMVTQPLELRTETCLLKFLIIEKYGVVELVNFFGPEEDWDLENNYSTKKVVPSKSSRYEVYKRMTENAITHLDRFTPIWTYERFSELISFLFKYGDVFKQKCRLCGRILSAELLVPTTFDENEETPRHKSCTFMLNLIELHLIEKGNFLFPTYNAY